MIEIRDLHKSFNKNKVLKGINFNIIRGESAVIIGRSGTGKSVLLKCILGLINADEGNVILNGEELYNKKMKYISQKKTKIGMLFQGGALFDSLKIWQNVSFYDARKGTRKKICYKKAIENLNKVGLDEKVANLFPSELSGGMQKRVALARAISIEPEVLFFDEPTTGLDPISADVINRLILEKVKDIGATAITITHDMASARVIADKIHMIHEGRIIWSGNIGDMEESSNKYVNQFINGKSLEPVAVDKN